MNENPNGAKYNPKEILSIGISISIAIIAAAIYFYRKKFNGNFSNDTAIWGQFGDYLNVFIGIANLIIVTVLTYVIFDLQRLYDVEKEAARKIEENENETARQIAENKKENARKIEEKDKEIAQKVENELQKLHYCSNLASRSLKFTEALMVTLLKYSETIKKNPMILPSLYGYSKSEIEILVRKINQEEYFHAYVNQVGGFEIEEIFISFDIILGNYESFLEYVIESRQYDHEKKLANNTLLRQSRNEIRNIVRKLKAEKKEESEEFSFFNAALLVYVDCAEKDAYDLLQFRKKFYEPILYYLLDDKRKSNPDYKTLLDLVSDANQSITPIQAANLIVANKIIEIHKIFSEVYNSVKPKVEKLAEFVKSHKG